MTKEEAINVLKSECYVFNPLNFDRTTLINMALDTAIEALKQSGKTCEGCRYENNAGFVEDCHYCNRWGSDRYQKREEMEEDGDDN